MESHKQNFVHVFTVDDLNHLHRGGRVNKATAIVGTLAAIKPILTVDKEGHLNMISKARGRKKALLALVDTMRDKIGSYADKNDIVCISHGDCIEDAEFVADKVKEQFGIENFLISNIGPTIGAHTGPGVMTLFFMGDERA
jgi:DegV family protein with EDD domain